MRAALVLVATMMVLAMRAEAAPKASDQQAWSQPARRPLIDETAGPEVSGWQRAWDDGTVAGGLAIVLVPLALFGAFKGFLWFARSTSRAIAAGRKDAEQPPVA